MTLSSAAGQAARALVIFELRGYKAPEVHDKGKRKSSHLQIRQLFSCILIFPDNVIPASTATMTVNHIFLMVTASKLPSLRAFYLTALESLGYKEMIRANNDTLIGYGSDYPYFWLKALPDDQAPVPTHIAFDAPDFQTVDKFHLEAL